MTQSLWVIRNRDTGDWWNGFGFTKELNEARTYSQDSMNHWDSTIWPFTADILELRLIERDSDGCPHCIDGTCIALEIGECGNV